ncbi:putative glycosyltransferase [Mycolicibacterium anyangense]|uniref:Putative glycosyltransferase n=1 Tax=Mycolicibacterium anyangense TaxID=1431246 RepID=A0A6N4WC56_9MYCO|nr:glycosyltransferase family 2 protein [Mycolicibacterium anyangense]BBZ79560.1 putative glycosyltransferase [Mycolicibacterium anyangense]
MRTLPLISVITITLNDLDGLVYTVNTVENQTYSNYEHIVIDGLSSDGTVDFCADAEQRLSRFSYVSEKDRGIFDAMNKGARKAQGDLLVFINSSDGFTHPSVLDFVANRWSESEDWQWGYGAMRFTDANRMPFSGTVQAPFDRRKFEFGRQYIPHPASYVSRRLFLETGGFDESFGTAADQEFFVRICRTHAPAVWIEFLADFMAGGVHSTESIWHTRTLWHLMRVKNGAAIGSNRYVDRVASAAHASAEHLASAARKQLRRI